MTSRYFATRPPRLFGHRGAAAHFPENTLPSFGAALEAGATYLEMDVWTSADGHVVVHHDETCRRLCGDGRRIASCTLAELKEMDAGYGFSPDGKTHPFRAAGLTIATLGEVFEAFPSALCNIEIKQADPPIEELVLSTINRSGRGADVLLAAEQDSIMRRLRPLCGPVPTSLSFGETAEFFAWVKGGCRKRYEPPGVALQIPEAWKGEILVTADTVAAAHAVGLEVHVWTVNETEDMIRLLDAGVDGLMSDYPERLVAVADRFRA